MDVRLEETITLDFTTHRFDTGAVTDDDAAPTVEVFEDSADTTLAGITVTKRTAKTGNYRVVIVCTAANGYEAGKSYNAVATATVNSIVGKGVIGSWIMRPAIASVNLEDGAITAAKIATDAIAGAQVAADAVTKIQAGLSTYAGGDTAGVTDLLTRITALRAGYIDNLAAGAVALDSTVAKTALLTTVAGYLDTEISAILLVAQRLDGALELNGGLYRWTVAALANAPTGGAAPSVGDIRTEMESGAGALLPLINAKTTNLPASPAAVGSNMGTVTGGTITALTNAPPDSAGITTLLGKLTGITVLANWLRLMFRSDAADATAKSEMNSGGGTSDESTDSAQAIRDQGDAAWATGGATQPLNAQETRDALKLAPTAGAPAAGSIDAELDTIVAAGGMSVADMIAGGIAKEATVLGQVGVTWGISYPQANRDGEITIARGDVTTLTLTLGAAFPLTGRTVYFCVQKRHAATNALAIVNRAMTITSIADRTCTITLTAAETATVGRYHYEVELRDTTTEATPSTADTGTLNVIDDLRK